MVSLTFAVFASTILTASAQFVTNSTTGEIICTNGAGNFCGGSFSSLTTPIIIRCNGSRIAQSASCNDNLSGVPPIGVKTNALCYQTYYKAGDAACSIDGVAYPDNGAPFKIPTGPSSAPPTNSSSVIFPNSTMTGTGPNPTYNTVSGPVPTETGTNSPNPTNGGSVTPTKTGSGGPTGTVQPGVANAKSIAGLVVAAAIFAFAL